MPQLAMGDDNKDKMRFTPGGKLVPGTYSPVEKFKVEVKIVDQARIQKCDPKLMEEFYQNLFLLACQRSNLEGCPTKINSEMVSGWAQNALFLAMLSGGKLLTEYKAAGQVVNARQAFSPHNSNYQKFISFLQNRRNVTLPKSIRAVKNSKGSIASAVILVALLEIMTRVSSPTRECKDKLEFIDYDDDCNPQIEAEGDIKVGEESKKFLSLSPSEQEIYLSANPKLCAHWGKFNDLVRNMVNLSGEVQNIRCDRGDGIHRYEVKTPRGDNKIFQLKVDESGKIAALKVQRSQALSDLSSYTMDFAEIDGERAMTHARYQNGYGISRAMDYFELRELTSRYRAGVKDGLSIKATEIFQGFREHKFYSNLVTACCSLPDDKVRGECVAELEGHQGISLKEASAKAGERHLAPATLPATAISEAQ
jgi:hypothetical protein